MNEHWVEMSNEEACEVVAGADPITLTLVLTIMAISVMAMVVWKLFTSTKGKISLPGGFNFEWSPTYVFPFLR